MSSRKNVKVPQRETLPAYIVNFDELKELLEITLDEETSRKLTNYAGESLVFEEYTEIPAIKGDYLVFSKKFDYNIKLTEFTYGQTAWKDKDVWSLWVGRDCVLEDIFTKELADTKRWEVFSEIPKNTEIKLILKNNSGNHRGVWISIGYFKEV